MTTVEVVRLKQQARRDLAQADKKEGLLASAEGELFGGVYGRDTAITCIFLSELAKIRPVKEFQKNNKKYLLTLTKNQGTKIDPETGEKPGEIQHENLSGPAIQPKLVEMQKDPKSLWPVKGPEGKLYLENWYSADATPLYLAACGEYIKTSDDWEFFHQIKPNILAALNWMEEYGGLNKYGYVVYQGEDSPLVNQGWKDSWNSILTPEGKHPQEPIALVEVQGYVYWAYNTCAAMFEKTAEIEFARKLRAKAGQLKERFNRDFWMEGEQFAAFALDGEGNQIKDIVSNAGHLLITGILDEDRAAKVVERLMQADIWTPYGIRTLSEKSPNFRFSEDDPKIQAEAYHNGSVWPFDSTLVALGMLKYGLVKEAATLVKGVLSAVLQLGDVELHQVSPHPEWKLVPYLKAAKPQTWTSASTLLCIKLLSVLRREGITNLFGKEIQLKTV